VTAAVFRLWMDLSSGLDRASHPCRDSRGSWDSSCTSMHIELITLLKPSQLPRLLCDQTSRRAYSTRSRTGRASTSRLILSASHGLVIVISHTNYHLSITQSSCMEWRVAYIYKLGIGFCPFLWDSPEPRESHLLHTKFTVTATKLFNLPGRKDGFFLVCWRYAFGLVLDARQTSTQPTSSFL
jgi:hypothetical protein